MAENALNTVYQGKGGTGGAYILPNNQAIGIFASGLQDINERKRLEEAYRLKREQKLADENAKAIASLKIDDHWGERSAELQNDYNALTDYALKAIQDGKNLNADKPFLKMRNQLVTKAGATNDLHSLYKDVYQAVGKNPDGYENGIDLLKSVRGVSMDDFMGGKFKPDSLRKIYSLADAIKESDGKTSYVKNNDGTYDTTRVDRSNNVGQAVASLSTNPAKYIIKKKGGDTGKYIEGFPTITAEGKRYYNTQGPDFESAVIDRLATDVDFPAFLQTKGYNVDTIDNIRNSALDFAKKQNEATGTYVKDYADNLENKATTDTTRVFSAEANKRANLNQQRRDTDSKQSSAGKPTFWQDIINRSLDGEPGSGEYIFDAVKAGIEKKGQKLTGQITYKKALNGTAVVTVPKIHSPNIIEDENGISINKGNKVIESRTFKYDPNNREQAARVLTDLLNSYSDDKVPYSKLFTPQGKGIVPGGKSERTLQNSSKPQPGKIKGTNLKMY